MFTVIDAGLLHICKDNHAGETHIEQPELLYGCWLFASTLSRHYNAPNLEPLVALVEWEQRAPRDYTVFNVNPS